MLSQSALFAQSEPAVSISASALAFDEQVLGSTSPAQQITLTNHGASIVKVESIAADGDFSQTNNCTNRVAPGASCSIFVSYAPKKEGTGAATLTIRHSASQSPISVSLTGPAIAGINKISHIVFLIKENRTFDNYFGTFPGANGATTGMISTGQVIPLTRAADRTEHDLGHSWSSSLTAIDGGKMDQFDLIPDGTVNGDYAAYTEFTEKDIPNYFAYARQFVLSDNTFSSLKGASFSNHLYMIAAQSLNDRKAVAAGKQRINDQEVVSPSPGFFGALGSS